MYKGNVKLSMIDEDLHAELTSLVVTRSSKYWRVKHRQGEVAYLHQVIMGRMDPKYVPNMKIVVDHINGDSFDNRRDNLRLISRSNNARNRVVGGNSRSGYRGVCTNGNPPTYYARLVRLKERWDSRTHKDPYEAYLDFLCMHREKHGFDFERAEAKDIVKSQNRQWVKKNGGGYVILK